MSILPSDGLVGARVPLPDFLAAFPLPAFPLPAAIVKDVNIDNSRNDSPSCNNIRIVIGFFIIVSLS